MIFFFSILQKRLNKANLNVWQIPSAVNIFNAWTLQGTRTLPSTYLEPLVPTLKDMFESGPTRERAAAKIVSKNDILWSFLRPYILNTLAEGLDYIGDDLSFQTALYRHSPERAAAYSYIDPSQMYKEMCGANELSEMIKPTLMNMRSIFTGFHNNALAWHTALAVCAKDDPTIVGSWLKMLEPFSTLRLDPKDPNAWKFWHSLSECCTSEASGRNLILFLSQRQQEMSQAFNKNWSMVETLFEGVERCERAAQMHQLHQHVELALPTMCSEEHLLQ